MPDTTQAGMTERERIARIIDRKAFDFGYQPERGGVQNIVDAACKLAYEKADQILALRSHAQPDWRPIESAAQAAWDWLAARPNYDLCHEYDEPEDDGEWRAYSVNGGRNDREWTLRGRGDTPLGAVQDAMDTAAAAPPAPSPSKTGEGCALGESCVCWSWDLDLKRKCEHWKRDHG